MKCRTSFVTNSSSSSFILAFKDEKDLSSFREACCEWYNYEDFYKLIENLASDYLGFYNNTSDEISIRPFIEDIRHINWGRYANYKLKKLYDEDCKINPYDEIFIKLSDFGICEIDLDEINLDEFCEDEYGVEIFSRKENRDKEKALEFLRNVYSHEFKLNILDEKFGRGYSLENCKQRYEYEKSDELKLLLEEHLKDNEEYQEKKRQVEDSEIVVQGKIWDTSGGLLEWAIRNGFIEDNFYRNCVICYNVG